MSASILSSNDLCTEIVIKIEHDRSMADFEDKLQDSLNEAGQIGVQKELEWLDTDGSPIMLGDIRLTSKSKKELKIYESPWGAVKVKRFVYQTSKGGAIFCPLDQAARIIVASTPRHARMVSWKFAHMASTEVEQDFAENHNRIIHRRTAKDLAEVVASIAQIKEENWTYEIPEMPAPVATVSIGLDAASLLYKEGKRMAMCGTIGLYDCDGNRMHTIYTAAAPEYGKEVFAKRFSTEINKINKRYPDAVYVGIADGAQDNWTFLEPITSVQILDFYHVSEYVSDASEAIYPGQKMKSKRRAWLKKTLHELKHDPGKSKVLYDELNEAIPGNKQKIAKESLEKAKTYFKNHWHQMLYPEALEKNFPIGSGVTEAACKTLIKQRMCKSGMRWKEQGASMLLTLRTLVKSNGHWESFWSKMDRYGFPVVHNQHV